MTLVLRQNPRLPKYRPLSSPPKAAYLPLSSYIFLTSETWVIYSLAKLVNIFVIQQWFVCFLLILFEKSNGFYRFLRNVFQNAISNAMAWEIMLVCRSLTIFSFEAQCLPKYFCFLCPKEMLPRSASCSYLRRVCISRKFLQNQIILRRKLLFVMKQLSVSKKFCNFACR